MIAKNKLLPKPMSRCSILSGRGYAKIARYLSITLSSFMILNLGSVLGTKKSRTSRTAGNFLGATAWAQTCTAGVNCPPPRVEFVPGQRIRVEIMNLTQTLVYAEKVQGEPPIDVIPGQVSFFVTAGGSINNLSVLIWDNRGSILTLRPVKVDNNTLRIEVRAGNTPPGDRTVYLRNDGRVLVL
ncbi:MAG: hypothetical protein HC916_15810 [Coleofasciculaceae cyanobacterium SM2_1_6]|nr:hypothetical protein [Coleofasciculaceae cyanobacterium SM2_1_6]